MKDASWKREVEIWSKSNYLELFNNQGKVHTISRKKFLLRREDVTISFSDAHPNGELKFYECVRKPSLQWQKNEKKNSEAYCCIFTWGIISSMGQILKVEITFFLYWVTIVFCSWHNFPILGSWHHIWFSSASRALYLTQP